MTHQENMEAADALVEYAAEVARLRTQADTDPARSWTAAPTAAEQAADEARRAKYLDWLK